MVADPPPESGPTTVSDIVPILPAAKWHGRQPKVALEAPTILNITKPLPEGPVPRLPAPTTSSRTKKKTKQSKVPKATAHTQVTKADPAEPACGPDSVAIDLNNTTTITKLNTTQREPTMTSSDSVSLEAVGESIYVYHSNQQRSTKKMQVPVEVATIPDFDPTSGLDDTSMEDLFKVPPRLAQEEPVGKSPSPNLLMLIQPMLTYQ